jgi:N-acetyl-anhydromuramyl-L-alanine amidase AmpD
MNWEQIVELLMRLFSGVKVTKTEAKTVPAKEAKQMVDQKKFHIPEKINRKINKIYVHVSDTPDSRNDIGAAQIKKWHTDPKPQGNGWSDIGYHYVVKRNGTLEDGRSLDVAGAHVAGHNANSIGICWVGRNEITPDQEDTLIGLIKTLLVKLNLKPSDVLGHKESDPSKTCPNLDMDDFRSKL